MSIPVPKTRPRVAILVLHGVGDQKEGCSAKAAGDLLLNANSANFGFRETALNLPVQAVAFQRPQAAGPPKQARSPLTDPWNWKRWFLFRQRAETKPEAEVAHTYMREQLSIYEPSKTDLVYETRRVEGIRADPATPGLSAQPAALQVPVAPGAPVVSQPERDIHIYEAYWADLSRFQNTVLGALLALYQLCFDLVGLGRKALHAIRHPAGKKLPFWKATHRAHRFCEVLLAQVIPLLNLILLAVSLPVILHFVKGYERVVCASACGLAATLAGGGLAWVWRERLTGRAWGAVYLAIVGLGAATAFSSPDKNCFTAAAVVIWSLSAAALFFVAVQLARRQRGTMTVFLAGLAFGAWCLWPSPPVDAPDLPEWSQLVDRMLRAIGAILVVLEASWQLLLAGILVTAVLGRLMIWRAGRAVRQKLKRALSAVDAAKSSSAPAAIASAETDLAVVESKMRAERARLRRLRRAQWTADLTVILPTFLAAVLTLGIWQMLLRFLPDAALKDGAWLIVHHPFDWVSNLLRIEYSPTAQGTAAYLFENSARGLSIILIALLGASLHAAWSIAPAILGEIFPLRGKKAFSPAAAASYSLGDKLTAAFFWMRAGGEVFRWTLIGLLALGWFLFFMQWPIPKMEVLLGKTGLILLSALFAAGYLVRKPLGVVIDIAQDVINWLRLSPLDVNPRARIAARFASTLRYIAQWREPVERELGYDALIILAHSQGTVIAADVLRFLHRLKQDGDAGRDLELDRFFGGGKDPIPVAFYTMGCPLRQLYALRFPDLYSWVNAESTGPEREPLGVVSWANAYRSGDYVGRALWRDAKESPWDPASSSTSPISGVREACLGAGAHTHYWDDVAPQVGQHLDWLVGEV